MPKIAFKGRLPCSHDDVVGHIENARSLGLPYVREEKPHGRRLAVVGGGPSIFGRIEEIRDYTDIWAINGACNFLKDRGIPSTLFALDPSDFLVDRISGASRALLSSRCHPNVFQALASAEIQLFDLAQDNVPGGHAVWASTSAVLAVFQLATDLGYRDTTLYGCEGSFSEETHAYMNVSSSYDMRFVVECGGHEYLTTPDMYMQTIALAPMVRALREHFREESGGLLRAMVANDEHDITKISRALQAQLSYEPA